MRSEVVVIMSVYKNEILEYFESSVNSILNQNLPCELYIAVDGWLPKELEVYVQNLRKHSRITLFINKENRGLAYSLNVLIDAAISSGFSYIARMDSDDISLPNRLKSQYEFMEERSDIDISGAYCREFGATYASECKKLPLQHDELLDFSITRCPFIHPTVIFRSTVFTSGLRYPIDTHYTEDMALWFECLVSGKRFANIDLVLLNYRLNENTIVRRIGIKKSISEMSLRFKYMFALKKITLKNLFLISSRFVFHILPPQIVKVAYKHLR